MMFRWETQEDRLKRFMKIPAKRKLEWLNEMREFTLKFSSKKTLKIRQKLREL